MWLTFRAYGNYQSRAKARTRFMQDSLGGPENYKKAFDEKLKEVLDSKENLDIAPKRLPDTKMGDQSSIDHPRALPQKQPGLYTVVWHPMGGMADPDTVCALNDALASVSGAQLRLAPDESAYIVNLTGSEAQKILELTKDSAGTLFETSVSCIGASTCQQGLRDSQALLSSCVEAVRKAKIPDGALPQIHISGCPSSCGTHQTGSIGFRGGAKKVDGVMEPAFSLFVNGNERQGCEAMGREVGVILQSAIPDLLVKLGTVVAESGMNYERWNEKNPEAIDTVAKEFLV